MAKSQPTETHFEGTPVVGSALSPALRTDGLSKAMKVEPVELHTGDYVTLVLYCDVKAVNHVESADGEGLDRVHVLYAREGMLIDQDLLAVPMEEMRERIRRYEEQSERSAAADGDGAGDSESVDDGAAANGKGRRLASVSS